MNMEQLAAFVAVYNTRSFSGAAKQLIKSQSAVTQLIRGLESEMNITLFLRHARPVAPTRDAETFYPYAASILHTLQSGMEAVKAGRQDEDSFTLSYRSTSNNILDHFLYSAKLNQIPRITNISLQDYTKADHWEENTLYFVRDSVIQSKRIAFIPVWESKAYAMLSNESPLAGKQTITIQDLAGKTVLLPDKSKATTFAASLFRLFSSEPSIAIRILSDTESPRLLVQMHNYISFCTSEFVGKHDAFCYIPFEDGGIIKYGFASLTEFTPAMKAFIRQFTAWLNSSAQAEQAGD